jgi:hypothetical protein
VCRPCAARLAADGWIFERHWPPLTIQRLRHRMLAMLPSANALRALDAAWPATREKFGIA